MTDKIKVIEKCEVAPPPGSLSSTTLPLTFFDLPWFYCHPMQRIFFYEYPYPTQHFLQSTLPILKHSLSLTLQHFFSFVSNLIVPPHSNNNNNNNNFPYIRYLDGDSLTFTVVESTQDFNILVSDSQDAQNWHPLVPKLSPPRTEEDSTRVFPLMTIQVTILPNAGFSFCFTFNHLASDAKSLHHFIKYWACVCKSKGNFDGSISLPFHEREKVKDPKGLKLIYYKELQDPTSGSMEFEGLVQEVSTNKVRTTLVLSREQVENLKKWVTLNYGSKTFHVSTFVVTCSLIWISMIKSEQEGKGDGDEICYLVFLADCRGHPQLSIPTNYFGNCIASLIVGVKRGELVGENGMVVAANSIEKKVRDFKSDALVGAETLMSDYRELGKSDKSVVIISGSPKSAVYETDFGWGKPKKSDSVHIDSSGSISLTDCRDKEAAIEVGLALERIRTTKFINILEEQLQNI